MKIQKKNYKNGHELIGISSNLITYRDFVIMKTSYGNDQISIMVTKFKKLLSISSSHNDKL